MIYELVSCWLRFPSNYFQTDEIMYFNEPICMHLTVGRIQNEAIYTINQLSNRHYRYWINKSVYSINFMVPFLIFSGLEEGVFIKNPI